MVGAFAYIITQLNDADNFGVKLKYYQIHASPTADSLLHKIR